MEKYNYMEAIKEDIRQYIDFEGITIDNSTCISELAEELEEELWTSDSVTGNASGSYTFSTWKAEEFICHNMELAKEAYDALGYSELIYDNAELIDVTIRLYLLPYAIAEVLEELENSLLHIVY